jgi:hypothetical protein
MKGRRKIDWARVGKIETGRGKCSPEGRAWDFLRTWHADQLVGLSGTTVRVWMFYAAGGGSDEEREPDWMTALYLGCDPSTLSECRSTLLEAGLIRKHGRRYWVPEGE